MTFSSLGLHPSLLRAVADKKYPAPTEIQLAAIPLVLQGRDLCASARTGSGKTASFALPILHGFFGDSRESLRHVGALVLAPTRELAMQIGESFRAYARYQPRPVKIVIVFGGVSINPQMMALRGGAEIVIATPGRLLDLIDHNALRLDAVSTLVLDEADKMLDLGFADEIMRIVHMLPAQRQTLLFSATFPDSVQGIAGAILKKPIHIEIESGPSDRPAIAQRAIAVDTAERTQLLRHLIQGHGWSRVLVFVATKYTTEHVAEKLDRAGVPAAPFHGELSQGTRTQALADFKASKLKVLIATDIAARGIDIAQLPVVVNYDLPRSAVDYTHRIGRTARAGASGIAVSFVSADNETHFRLIEDRNGVRLPREIIPGFEPQETAVKRPPTGIGGIKGKRKSKKDKLREAALKSGGNP